VDPLNDSIGGEYQIVAVVFGPHYRCVVSDTHQYVHRLSQATRQAAYDFDLTELSEGFACHFFSPEGSRHS